MNGGKSKVFPKAQVAAQLKVGWYTEPVQRLYAEGKSKVFPKSQVAAQLKVGWYAEPVQRLYAEGKSKLFPQSQVASQLNVGWYVEPVQRLYAPGKSALFQQSQVAAQLKVGWSTKPVKAYVPQVQKESSQKRIFLKEAENIELYEDLYLANAMTTWEINTEVVTLYEKWDNLLNKVYAYLKKVMPANEFKALQAEQVEWIAEKEYAISVAGWQVRGGTMESVEKNSTAMTYTKERCYYLLSWVK